MGKTCSKCNLQKDKKRFLTKKGNVCSDCFTKEGGSCQQCDSCGWMRDTKLFVASSETQTICKTCIDSSIQKEQQRLHKERMEYNSFASKIERFKNKNNGNVKNFCTTEKNIKKVKCKNCQKILQPGLMSIEDNNLCPSCYQRTTVPKKVVKIDHTPEREWRTEMQRSSRKEYQRIIKEGDTKDVLSSKPQLQIAKFLMEKGHHVEIERKIAFGYKNGCAANYTADLRAKKENANFSFMERTRSLDIFVNENLVIEFDGTFYHMDERFYGPDDYNKKLKKTAKEVWSKDKQRNDEIVSHGYDLLIIKEYDFVNNRSDVLEQVLQRAEKAKQRKLKKIEEYKRQKGLL